MSIPINIKNKIVSKNPRRATLANIGQRPKGLENLKKHKQDLALRFKEYFRAYNQVFAFCEDDGCGNKILTKLFFKQNTEAQEYESLNVSGRQVSPDESYEKNWGADFLEYYSPLNDSRFYEEILSELNSIDDTIQYQLQEINKILHKGRKEKAHAQDFNLFKVLEEFSREHSDTGNILFFFSKI